MISKIYWKLSPRLLPWSSKKLLECICLTLTAVKDIFNIQEEIELPVEQSHLLILIIKPLKMITNQSIGMMFHHSEGDLEDQWRTITKLTIEWKEPLREETKVVHQWEEICRLIQEEIDRLLEQEVFLLQKSLTSQVIKVSAKCAEDEWLNCLFE